MTGRKFIIQLWVCLISAVGVVIVYLLSYSKSLLVHPLHPLLRGHMLPTSEQLKQLNVQAASGVVTGASNNLAKGFTVKPSTMKCIDIHTEYVYACNMTQTSCINSTMKSINITVPTSFIISLTPSQQWEFVSASVDKQRWWPKFDSFPEKELPEFLPNYKSPCWFNKTHHLRCLPYFLLAGFPKAGTTDLYDMLLVHPDFKPYVKEPHWIARERLCRTEKTKKCVEDNFDRYTNDIAAPLSALLETEYGGSRSGNGSKGDIINSSRRHRWYHNLRLSNLAKYTVTGDCSASTLWDNFDWQQAKENTLPLEPTMTNADYIHHLNNKTKTIVILRNPIARLYSEFLYFDDTHTRDAIEFHDMVVKGVQLFYKCLGHYSLRHCVYSRRLNSQIKGVRLYIGIYFIHLRDWLRVFPRDQIFVVQLEEYTNHREETIQKIYSFLQLRNITKLPEAKKLKKRARRPKASNANKHGTYKNQTMFEETRTILYQFYKPFNRALAQLLNDSRFDYGPF